MSQYQKPHLSNDSLLSLFGPFHPLLPNLHYPQNSFSTSSLNFPFIFIVECKRHYPLLLQQHSPSGGCFYPQFSSTTWSGDEVEGFLRSYCQFQIVLCHFLKPSSLYLMPLSPLGVAVLFAFVYICSRPSSPFFRSMNSWPIVTLTVLLCQFLVIPICKYMIYHPSLSVPWTQFLHWAYPSPSQSLSYTLNTNCQPFFLWREWPELYYGTGQLMCTVVGYHFWSFVVSIKLELRKKSLLCLNPSSYKLPPHFFLSLCSSSQNSYPWYYQILPTHSVLIPCKSSFSASFTIDIQIIKPSGQFSVLS